MCDAVILSVGDGEGNSPVMFGHRFDEGFKSFYDHRDMVVRLWVGRSVAEDGSAKGDGVINLLLGRMYCLKDRNSDSFNLRRGRGEAREVFLNLTGCRIGFLLANIPF